MAKKVEYKMKARFFDLNSPISNIDFLVVFDWRARSTASTNEPQYGPSTLS